MGIVAPGLLEEARALDRPCRRLALIDRRSPAEQDAVPYIMSEFRWLDQEAGSGGVAG